MESIVLDRRKTFFHNDFLNDYYNTDKLDELRTYAPNIDEIGKAIDSKKGFSQDRREVLASVLREQYKDAGINILGELEHNINSLGHSNTYTVTTGQQIHLGLGPLYVIYKAFDAIVIAKELSEKYTDCNFVPIFWMATEDHDLEEIAEINIFGNKLKWETNQKGAVGRMKPDGVADLFESIKRDYNFSEVQSDFLDICIRIYSTSSNLSIAFRRILHEYIGETGIVILDADNKKLKESFTEVMMDELEHKNYDALIRSTSKLEEAGYDKQLHIRECNLFDMSNGDRVKVNGGSRLAKSQVQQDIYNLSPNAALRPFYQEWILPNLVYVGGSSEIKYWLQLKGIFDNYQLTMPLIHLRTSNIILPKKVQKSYGSKDFEMLFKNEDEIAIHYSKELKALEDNFEELLQSILKNIETYSELASQSFRGFSLEGKVNKILPKIIELRSLTKIQLVKKSEQNPDLNKLLKTKAKYFSSDTVQERREHVLEHLSILGIQPQETYSHFGLKKSQKISLLFV